MNSLDHYGPIQIQSLKALAKIMAIQFGIMGGIMLSALFGSALAELVTRVSSGVVVIATANSAQVESTLKMAAITTVVVLLMIVAATLSAMRQGRTLTHTSQTRWEMRESQWIFLFLAAVIIGVPSGIAYAIPITGFEELTPGPRAFTVGSVIAPVLMVVYILLGEFSSPSPIIRWGVFRGRRAR